MNVEVPHLVEKGQIIELGDPVFVIYSHPQATGRYFAVKDESPYFCLEANSIIDAAKKAQEVLDFIAQRRKEYEEDDCA